MTDTAKKILLIGHGRHGKDTVAEILRDYHGMSFRSSSNWAAEHVIYPAIMETAGSMVTSGRDWRWFYEHRHEDKYPFCGRQFWFDTMLKYNKREGGSAIARGVLAEVDCYVGMRSRYEFDAAVDEGLFDLVIWVDRSEHCPPERGSMELTPEDAHIIIDNNGTLRDLWLAVDYLVQEGLPKHG